MDASLIISILALAVSGVSVYFVYQRERRDRLRFEREEEDRKDRKKARPTAEYVGFEIEDGRRVYTYVVANGGEAPAMHVMLLVKNRDGVVIGRSPYGVSLLSEQSRVLRVTLNKEESLLIRPFSLLIAWRNARNEPDEHLSDAEIPY